jgi:hypothetical protein
MGLYRKKPVVIEAEQLTADNLDQLAKWCGGAIGSDGIWIQTLEGTMLARFGEWILKEVKGVNDEFYPCKPDIFEKTYEKVDTTCPSPFGKKVDCP